MTCQAKAPKGVADAANARRASRLASSDDCRPDRSPTALRCRVDHKVLLTGTPLQNHLGELFMLLHFLEPEKFPSLAAWEARFSNLGDNEQVGGSRGPCHWGSLTTRLSFACRHGQGPAIREDCIPIALCVGGSPGGWGLGARPRRASIWLPLGLCARQS